MRTLVDIGDKQVDALDRLARESGKSRAALIRAAIDDYLSKRLATGTHEAFGLWGKRKSDGVAFQERARREW
jgi:metal-responsive CopG/Arc/MetJ family transcriptional regulator